MHLDITFFYLSCYIEMTTRQLVVCVQYDNVKPEIKCYLKKDTNLKKHELQICAFCFQTQLKLFLSALQKKMPYFKPIPNLMILQI